jgi:hypothetical protein
VQLGGGVQDEDADVAAELQDDGAGPRGAGRVVVCVAHDWILLSVVTWAMVPGAGRRDVAGRRLGLVLRGMR